MDGLSIITGIAIVSFLLFYLAFSLQREHNFLRILTVMAAVFILLYIPTLTVRLDRDCSILSNGTYLCFLSNGTQVTNYGDNNVTSDFLKAYMWYIRIFMIYVFIYLSYYVLRWIGIPIDKIRFRTMHRRMV